MYLGTSKLVSSNGHSLSITQYTVKSLLSKYKFKIYTRVSILEFSTQASSVWEPESSGQQEQGVATYLISKPRAPLHTSERGLTNPQSSVLNILRKTLRMVPYDIQIFPQMWERDYAARTCLDNRYPENIQSYFSFSIPYSFCWMYFIRM